MKYPLDKEDHIQKHEVTSPNYIDSTNNNSTCTSMDYSNPDKQYAYVKLEFHQSKEKKNRLFLYLDNSKSRYLKMDKGSNEFYSVEFAIQNIDSLCLWWDGNPDVESSSYASPSENNIDLYISYPG